jgi:hypothetical protein
MVTDEQGELEGALSRWQLDVKGVRERLYRAPTPRERERWHARWLALHGWPAARVAAALGRDPDTVDGWLAAFRREGPAALAFVRAGGSPPP